MRSPLESIDPWRIVAGLSYERSGRPLGRAVIVTYSSKKDERPGAALVPDAFTILDLTAYFNSD